jgi:hypothetical protein
MAEQPAKVRIIYCCSRPPLRRDSSPSLTGAVAIAQSPAAATFLLGGTAAQKRPKLALRRPPNTLQKKGEP